MTVGTWKLSEIIDLSSAAAIPKIDQFNSLLTFVSMESSSDTLISSLMGVGEGWANDDIFASWVEGNPNYFRLLFQGEITFLCFPIATLDLQSFIENNGSTLV